MKTSSVTLCLLTATLFAVRAPAQDQPPPPPPDRAPPGHERLLERFDANHDGKLDDSEKAAARAEWQKHRAERGPGDGFGFHGRDEFAGPDGFGPGGPGDDDQPRHRWGMMKRMRHLRHQEMMRRFDHDHDGRLNDAEYAEAQKARAEMQAHRKENREMILQRFDADHDGRLNETERHAMRDAWQEFLKARPVLPPAPATAPPAK